MKIILHGGPSWPRSSDSWIYNYQCSQCLSPVMLWFRISIRTRCTTLCDQVCQWLATARWFSPGPPVSSTNKTDRHNITEILLKVALNTIKQSNKQTNILHGSRWLSGFLKSLKLNTTDLSPRTDTHTKCYDFQTPTIHRGLLHPSDGYPSSHDLTEQKLLMAINNNIPPTPYKTHLIKRSY